MPVAERQVYELIARRYLVQFLPAFEFDETRIELQAGGERFRAAGRQTIAVGWAGLAEPLRADADTDSDGAEQDDDTQALPLLREGEGATMERVSVTERQTMPPRRFTDAALIQAMTGIARFVADPAIKKVLRETDGLGAPATPRRKSSRRCSSDTSSSAAGGSSCRRALVGHSSTLYRTSPPGRT